MAWGDVRLEHMRHTPRPHAALPGCMHQLYACCVRMSSFLRQWHVSRVACARYGGPIAMVRDDRKLVVVTGGLTKPVVRIFTAAGAPLAAFVWDAGRVAAMGWTSEEDLLMVEDNGEVRCWAHLPCMPLHHAPGNVKCPHSFMALGSCRAALRGFMALGSCRAALRGYWGYWGRGK